jgi:Na+-transporting NADH:ubiquinone oxidoreductase subunit C
MQHSTLYTIGFAAAICLFCAVFVSGSAVSLKERQDENKILDRQKKVLVVAGLMKEGANWSADQIKSTFADNIQARVVDLKTGDYNQSVDVATFDQQKATKDPARSAIAPDNSAKVGRLPHQAMVYHVMEAGSVARLIIPVEGKGLWSTLYGFLALEKDVDTITGITFYQHGETPGLGGEVDNPKWKALWKGRKAFNAAQKPAIEVLKGQAGSVQDDPHHVDGLSGATITSRGVTYLVQFWLGEHGFGPYLAKFRAGGV